MEAKERMEAVERRIREACRRSGRSRDEVSVVAVTKHLTLHEAERLMELGGASHIGESRWPDARDKWEALHSRGTWHYIGHLQTNKVKDVISRFDYVHSLDRLPLAHEIERRAAVLDRAVRCFVQVNVSGETSKYGLKPEELFDFADQVARLPHIRVVGLMTMAPLADRPEAARPVFEGLRKLRDRLNAQNPFPYPVEHLSMGMSGDFEVAVEEGATWLRLGSIWAGR
ncbi:YggS family pyridoxal phosphate-dependent enzyme [Paenibacillus flagellatus]|uniref:Pyridoxal phosphate homeostasis protein n=1 Tax=Paenibacillus flagellatus TaxID=2211139 RepID=A0A2V5KUJ7_9BACL|nr:YggS family pyridoxal phosphate-dependent enzyme [Paenibacillus flagellatus]PYI55607.1 YggS family pyridoxal phosphate-dependent enzyme [Paenibacillus flagellatus]